LYAMKFHGKLIILLLLLTTGVIISGCERQEVVEPVAHEAFFQNMRDLCGLKFEGHTVYTMLDPHPLADARLIMHVAMCTAEEIRIPFIVNDDSSRTWVLTLSERGLLLKHDHRYPDGTPEDETMYGGWADDRGTALVQYFPADEYTAELIPDAETNVWMLELNPETNEFVYYLERHDEPRIRAVFDLSQPIEE
jgi:hypothetical protein